MRIIGIILIISATLQLNASPAFFSYQGRLFDSNEVALDSELSTIVIQILDPAGQCLLHEETHTLDMQGTSGYFKISVGLGALTANSPTFSFSDIFSNSVTFSDTKLNCAGNTYTPTSTHHRLMRVTVNGETLSPDHVIGGTPFSMQSSNSSRLDGNSYADIQSWVSGQISASGGGDFLADGSIPATGHFDMGATNRITNLAPPTLSTDATNKNYVDTKTWSLSDITDAGSMASTNTTAYYTKSNMQTNTQAQLHWGNITNVPAGLADGDNDTTYSAATGVADGLMTAADKNKLDNIDVHSLNAADGSPADALYVDNSGSVGIGTTVPGAKLDVEGGVSAHNFFWGTSDTSTQLGFYSDDSYRNGWQAFGDTNATSASSIKGVTNGVERIKIDGSGNVGVGTTSPIAKLHVNGGTDKNIKLHGGTASYGSTSGTAIFSTNDANDTFEDLSIAASNLILQAGPGTGNVGIGTTTPAGALDVTSTTGAFFPPRMTQTQRDNMGAIGNGAIVYNTTSNRLNIKENGTWVVMGSNGGINKDGTSAAAASASCLQLLNDGYSTGDGLYWVNVAGKVRQVHCDMTTDGGGWMVFARVYGNNTTHRFGFDTLENNWATNASTFISIEGVQFSDMLFKRHDTSQFYSVSFPKGKTWPEYGSHQNNGNGYTIGENPDSPGYYVRATDQDAGKNYQLCFFDVHNDNCGDAAASDTNNYGQSGTGESNYMLWQGTAYNPTGILHDFAIR